MGTQWRERTRGEEMETLSPSDRTDTVLVDGEVVRRRWSMTNNNNSALVIFLRVVVVVVCHTNG